MREYRTLFECIGDRCKRTGSSRLLPMAKHSKFKDNVFLLYSFTVLLDRALMREFVGVSQAIIDPKKLPDP